MANDIAIVLTGTIIPNSNLVSHMNVEERKKEYLYTLEYYKRYSPVYFLENSDYPLLHDPAFLNIEGVFLRKFPVSSEYTKGKGYQEFEMLDLWINSEKQLPARFIKITGRYVVTNIHKIYDECLKKVSWPLMIDRYKKSRKAYTSLFYIKSDYYKKYLEGLYRECDDSMGRWIEYVVFKRLEHSSVQARIFAHQPLFQGISGSTGGSIKSHFLKHIVKALMRKLSYNIDNKYIRLYG